MVWGGFNASGTLPLYVVSTKMNSADYINVLKDSLAPLCKKVKLKDGISYIIMLQYTKEKRLQSTCQKL